MRFEKWQALANDYVIVEAAQLPGAEPSAELVRALCDRHTGIGADGLLVLAPPDEPGFVARLRIFNADGSEAELSGNGAREAIMYLRRAGWTDAQQFSIQTAAGEIRPTILSETTCRVDMGRAVLRHDGELGGRRFQHLIIGNPQTVFALADLDALEALDLAAIGPPIEFDPQFPQRTNVSWFAAVDASTLRARIFERGVGETASSGTGACGAAIVHVLRGGDSPVTVRLDGGDLEVEVGEDLHVDLTGWAVPVYSGQLDAAFGRGGPASGGHVAPSGTP
jgi:diaminopimelate epimerase